LYLFIDDETAACIYHAIGGGYDGMHHRGRTGADFGAVKAENDLQLSPNYQRIKASVYKGQLLQERDWAW